MAAVAIVLSIVLSIALTIAIHLYRRRQGKTGLCPVKTFRFGNGYEKQADSEDAPRKSVEGLEAQLREEDVEAYDSQEDSFAQNDSETDSEAEREYEAQMSRLMSNSMQEDMRKSHAMFADGGDNIIAQKAGGQGQSASTDTNTNSSSNRNARGSVKPKPKVHGRGSVKPGAQARTDRVPDAKATTGKVVVSSKARESAFSKFGALKKGSRIASKVVGKGTINEFGEVTSEKDRAKATHCASCGAKRLKVCGALQSMCEECGEKYPDVGGPDFLKRKRGFTVEKFGGVRRNTKGDLEAFTGKTEAGAGAGGVMMRSGGVQASMITGGASKTCKSCKVSLKPGSAFCTECGTKQ